MMDMSLQDIFNLITKYATLLLSASQWHIVVLIILVTSITTNSVKKMLPRATLAGRKNQNHIYIVSFVLGIIATVIGYFVATVAQPLWFWLVTATLAGPISNFIYRVSMPLLWRFIAWKFPAMAERRNKQR